MSEHLKAVAEASLAVEEAEAALGDGEPMRAEEALDRADAALAALRAGWAEMGAAERTVVGRTAKPVRERADGLRARLPKRRALSEGAPEADPEQDVAPDGEDGPPVSAA